MSRVSSLIAASALLGLLLFVGTGSARLLERPFPGFLVWDNGTLVAFHAESWSGALAGLPLGAGRIVAVDGKPFAGGKELLDVAARRPIGSLIEYRVLADGEERSFRVPTMRLGIPGYLATFGNYLFNAVCFCGIALIALALRPDLPQARSLAIATGSIGMLFLLAIDYFSAYRLVRICQIVEALVPLALYGVAVRFPYPRLTPTLRRAGWLGVGLCSLVILGVQTVSFYDAPEAAQIATLAAYSLIALVTVSMLGGLATAALEAHVPEDRVRAGIVLAAAVSGLMVPAFAILAFFGLGGGFSFTRITFLLPIFPAAVLFAIVRHDLFSAERFARLAVGYGTTTAAIAVTYSALLLGLEQVLVGVNVTGRGGGFLLLIAIAISFHPLYQRVQNWVDRLFYRSELDAGRVLERISVLLAARVDEATVAAIVEREVKSAVAIEGVSVLIGDTSPSETAALEEPIVYHGELLGVLRCGPKSLGAPFSEAEFDLMVGVASLAAAAIHNARSLVDLRDAQAALVQAERLAAIGEVAGAVAHGLRNPLAGIRAAAQMAQEIEDPEELSNALGDLIEGTDRLDGRVRRLLDFARMLEPVLETVNLLELAGAVGSTVAAPLGQQDIKLTIDIDPRVRVSADPGQLEEVLIELVSNALRATSTGGEVGLRAKVQSNRVEIEVYDSGTGIPERVQNRIFDLFFTTRQTGTGMGLATVRNMLERQGGTIVLVQSTPEGTTFLVTLKSSGDLD